MHRHGLPAGTGLCLRAALQGRDLPGVRTELPQRPGPAPRDLLREPLRRCLDDYGPARPPDTSLRDRRDG